ncbi:MAG: hypothetical protein H7123_08955 [Thermoleophilia bacterium]|nr:hypothetical protein [Thermoleophilia bacterium]
MRIDLEQQRELYAAHADTAVDALIERITTGRDELIELGMARAFRDVGVHEYGDKTYFISAAQLREETDAELADAIFYEQIRVARDAGTLPPVDD